MKNSKIMTNEELQAGLSEKLREVNNDTVDPSVGKTYYIGARTLLTAVKLDMEGAKKLGVPIFSRTKVFLGIQE